MTMHAGEVVALPGSKIEAFYAQNWAFAEFLWDAENGKYRPAFQRLLTDCANGTVYPAGPARRQRAGRLGSEHGQADARALPMHGPGRHRARLPGVLRSDRLRQP